jgi:hypothetical protein
MKKIALLTFAAVATLGLAACEDTPEANNTVTDLNVTDEAVIDVNAADAADNALDNVADAADNATEALDNAADNATNAM